MRPLRQLSGRAIPFGAPDIDTDVIFPARLLLLMEREGLGRYLFADRRGEPGFPLDDPRYAGLEILIAGRNFGSGSSREQAVWAIAGAGIRVVIAPSFGEIFHANCFKNGVLPITVPESALPDLMAGAADGERFDVDLAAGTLSAAGRTLAIDIGPDRREMLLNGWDETALLLDRFPVEIAAFEAAHRARRPWLFSEGERA